MPEFLQLLPPQVALQRLLDHLPSPSLTAEWVETSTALGRVTAQAVLSPEPSPAFPRSTVDGFAVRSADTYGASDSLPAYLRVMGEIRMGFAAQIALQTGEAALIHTGGMLPDGADAVVMVEHTQSSRPQEIEIFKAVASGENTLAIAEDVTSGQTILPAGKSIRAAEIGGLLALGILQICVIKKPVIAILSTGDEIIPPQQTPCPGQIRDINSHTLAALLIQACAEPQLYGILPDNPAALQTAIQQALTKADVIIITAGSSASTRDMTAEVIQSAGKPGVLVHGVDIKPGKPTILGICDHHPVIGLPGNPVSALVIAWRLVLPLLRHLSGQIARLPLPMQARLTANLPSQAGREEWVPVRLISSEDGWQAEPIFYKSNLIFSLVNADGLLHIPPSATGLSAGETVHVYRLEP